MEAAREPANIPDSPVYTIDQAYSEAKALLAKMQDLQCKKEFMVYATYTERMRLIFATTKLGDAVAELYYAVISNLPSEFDQGNRPLGADRKPIRLASWY